jgi:pyruvate/2-oxoglutarate dehydrogenase complex dihydrolipoamide acyltransferase (E2) component
MIEIRLQDDAWTDVEEGTAALLDEWLVKPGDSVGAGQVLANVMVVKTSFEVAAPAAGTIAKLLVGAQDNFTRGQPLAELQPA